MNGLYLQYEKLEKTEKMGRTRRWMYFAALTKICKKIKGI